ncbi:MAG: acylneuraminate cytidylyltransferase [Chloroflexi bacterium]|nr:acylneuraminate cytidylyltransferase [Chloroflexota bacterium]
MRPRVLIVIPARGGSKAVPRKNVRTLDGRPLIAHAIATAASSNFRPFVLVSSDDDEILAIARSLGCTALQRPPELAGDDVTLDPVVAHALDAARSMTGKRIDIVVTLQPTSPLLSVATLDRAIDRLDGDPALDTVLSGTDDRHLRWTRVDGELSPLYDERVNRQQLPEAYRETGGFLITRARHVTPRSRIGNRVTMEVLKGAEAIDIDTVHDFMLCEAYLKRRRVAFVVAGYRDIGLGHVHNALALASELVHHELVFVTPRGHDLAADVIEAHNYPVVRQRAPSILDELVTLSVDVVVNDILDTEEAYVRALKDAGLTVINFEDLGNGARQADLVVNAIYPERRFLPNHYFGPRYFLARNEFVVGATHSIRPEVERVLVTFGGTDPSDLTKHVLAAIGPYCAERSIAIDVVLGRGYSHPRPAASDGVSVHQDVRNISEYMRRADVAFTSAGRTVLELALIGTPSIVLAQNERELTHLFATEANGFLNLGLGARVEPDELRAALADLVDSAMSRRRMHELMQAPDLRHGRQRVVALVEDAIMGR